MTRLLAFDTSTERMALALVDGDRVRTHEDEGGARASATLIARALELLAEAGIAAARLDAIAFGRGPGAFTGLRCACAVAQGFAFGAGVPVLAIDSLAIVADDARAQSGAGDVWVAMDARMDEIYAARYVHECESNGAAGRWRVAREPQLYALQALNRRWLEGDAPQAIAGSALNAFGDRLQTGAARRIAGERSRAEALARLAVAAWVAGPHLDPADALPLYLRDKVALTTVEREARAAQRR